MIEEADFQEIGNAAIDLCAFVDKLRLGEKHRAEADRLRGEIKELEKKLTETVKLLGERSRECGELQALLEVKNRSDISTQSTELRTY